MINGKATNPFQVVIDEASQLTEAALNAVIHSFPLAQLVLIGDSKQLPPFRYECGDPASELAARSALLVAKAKKNIPVIKLRRVYRAAPSAIAHYSECFYSGRLVSHKVSESRLMPFPPPTLCNTQHRRRKSSDCESEVIY